VSIGFSGLVRTLFYDLNRYYDPALLCYRINQGSKACYRFPCLVILPIDEILIFSSSLSALTIYMKLSASSHTLTYISLSVLWDKEALLEEFYDISMMAFRNPKSNVALRLVALCLRTC
jgi:hypothetical protein